MHEYVRKIFSAPWWIFSDKGNTITAVSLEDGTSATIVASDDALIITTADPALRDDIHEEFPGSVRIDSPFRVIVPSASL